MMLQHLRPLLERFKKRVVGIINPTLHEYSSSVSGEAVRFPGIKVFDTLGLTLPSGIVLHLKCS